MPPIKKTAEDIRAHHADSRKHYRYPKAVGESYVVAEEGKDYFVWDYRDSEANKDIKTRLNVFFFHNTLQLVSTFSFK